MSQRRDRHAIYFAVFLFVLAPIGAVVVVTLLLALGVHPPLVFAPGRALRWLLELCGFRVPNRVPVAATVIFWWALFAAAGSVWDRRRPFPR